MGKYINDKDNRRFQSAHRTPGGSLPEPKSQGESGGDALEPTRPSDGAPKGSDRAQSGRRTSGRASRGSTRPGELLDAMSSGIPKVPIPSREHGAYGVKGYCTPLNSAPGERMTGLSEESDAALRQMGGLRKTTVNSSIIERKKVTLPSEGGPDSQRSG